MTGGEPLAQQRCLALLTALCDQGYDVSLETSGALDVSAVDARVIKIMDIKTPGSLESAKNNFENLNYLSAQDEIKFVITNREDYEWSKAIVSQFSLDKKQVVLFSASFGQLAYQVLADWILADGLNVRFQPQLHKIIWGVEASKGK